MIGAHLMTNHSTFTPGMAKFVMAVSAFSTHLGKCSAVYRNMGVTVAAWDIGNTTVQLADEDEVYMHYATPSVAGMIQEMTAGLSREMAGELVDYASGEGIPMGSPAPPKP
jgi:Na+/melibiose symporter-like transporter